MTTAKKAGHACDGWMLQGAGWSFVAWLYRDTEDGQWPLFDEVEAMPSVLQAAQWCLGAAKALSTD